MAPVRRLLVSGAGLLMVAVGIALLAASATGSAARLGRVAGILIVIGLVVLAVGMIGRV